MTSCQTIKVFFSFFLNFESEFAMFENVSIDMSNAKNVVNFKIIKFNNVHKC